MVQLQFIYSPPVSDEFGLSIHLNDVSPAEALSLVGIVLTYFVALQLRLDAA